MSSRTGPTSALRALPQPVPGQPYRILFVCTGNICRSPMAEVIARTMAETTTLADGSMLADHLIVTSAGTGGWHEGEAMDPRTAVALQRAGYPDHPHVARQVSRSGLAQADLLVALDRHHQLALRNLGGDPARISLLRSFDLSPGVAGGGADVPADVPDPYYGDAAGFDDCASTIAIACRGLVSGLAALWDAALSP